MKLWNWGVAIGIAVVVFLLYQNIESDKERNKEIRDIFQQIKSDISAIGQKIKIDEKEKVLSYKLQKNIELWQGTLCVQCHNTSQMALPITKLTSYEAIDVVRKGNPRSIAGGMPKFNPRPTRNGDDLAISDNDLLIRFNILYTDEFLQYAREAPPKIENVLTYEKAEQ